MAPCGSLLALTALCALVGCRAIAPPALDPEVASCIPRETQALAGIHVDEVRANPVLQKLSAEWTPLLDPAREASSVVMVYDGKNLLFIGRGSFRAAPSGGTLLDSRIALMGPQPLIRIATAQHATGRAGAPALIAQAEPIAKQPIWAVLSGAATLPLSGNSENVHRLLRLANFVTLAVEAHSGIALHLQGHCQSAEKAQELEQTMRGLLTMGGAAVRDRNLASLLTSIQIRRDDLTVWADVPEVAPELVSKLLHENTR